MIDPSGLSESAIVILVPEAEAVIGRLRAELDPSAALGVPAHVTLLYPFAAPIDVTEDLVAKVAATISGFGAFEYQLEDVRWFGDDVVWLAPDPVGRFVALTTTLLEAFPEFPRYGGAFGDDVVPHVTIGQRAPLERLQDAARSVASSLPVRARAREVALLSGDGTVGSWHVLQTVPLE
jgi:2'-5' RNA ligase